MCVSQWVVYVCAGVGVVGGLDETVSFAWLLFLGAGNNKSLVGKFGLVKYFFSGRHQVIHRAYCISIHSFVHSFIKEEMIKIYVGFSSKNTEYQQLKWNQVKFKAQNYLLSSGIAQFFSAGGGFDFSNKADLKSTKECPWLPKFPTNFRSTIKTY